MDEANGQPPSSDDQIFWMVRAGIVDAEIAVRLGISTAEVKQRIEALARKHGVEGRDGLKSVKALPVPGDTGPFETARRFPRWSAAIAVGALALGVGIGVFAGRASVDEQAVEPTTAAAAPTSTAAATSPTGGVVMEPGSEDFIRIEPDGMANLGQFFLPNDIPGVPWMTSVTAREWMTFVTLNGAGLASPTAPGWHSLSNYAYGITMAGSRRNVFFEPANGSTRITKSGVTMTVYSVDPGVPPELSVWAAQPSDTGMDRFMVSFNDAGDLLIGIDPVPRDLVIEQATGAALDSSRSTRLRFVTRVGATPSVHCLGREACLTTFNVSSPGLPAPTSGRVTCPDPSSPALDYDARLWENQTLTLDTGEFLLHYYRLAMGSGDIPPGDVLCGPSVVSAGDVLTLSGGVYAVTARDMSGNAINVVISGDGVTYVGDVGVIPECPCRLDRPRR